MDDVILEIDNKSMTNRPDLWGHYGIARELSAIYDTPLAPLPSYRWDFTPGGLRVKIEAPRDLGASSRGYQALGCFFE